MDMYSRSNLGPRVSIDFSEAVGRTKQSMKDECDVNNIMSKYQKTGMIDHFAKHSGEYGFATSIDFHGAMNLIMKAEDMFGDLPGEVRGRFNGDPGEFLAFVQDPENADEMLSLGLREAPPGPAAGPIAPAGDAPPGGAPGDPLEAPGAAG